MSDLFKTRPFRCFGGGREAWRAYRVCRAHGRLAEAAAIVAQALAADPHHPEFLLARAELLRYRVGDYRTAKADLRRLMSRGPWGVRARAAHMFLNYVWEREGATAELVDVIQAVVASSRPTFRALIRYAAILNDSGRPLEAVDLVERACRRNPGAVDAIAYVELVNAVASHGRLRPRRADLAARIVGMLDESAGRFAELLCGHGEDFCIVGNSPSLVGSGSGAWVDARPLVIRLNNYPTGHPYDQDYGSRTDVWVRSGFNDAVFFRPTKALRHLVICGNNPRHRYSDGLDLFAPYLEQGGAVETMPPSLYRELYARIGASPSAGLITLWWAFRTIGPVDHANVFGFSMTDNSDFVSCYPTGNVEGSVPSRHDWQAERNLFETIVRADAPAI